MNEKPENRKTITIKINGKDRPFQNKELEEKEEAKESTILHPKKTTENSSFYKEETAAGSESSLEDESFDWILPSNEEPIDSEKKSISFHTFPPNKSKSPFGKKAKTKENKESNKSVPKGMVASIFFAVFFAIILGTSFGFILLKMVNSEQVVANHSTTGTTTGSNSEQAKGTSTAAKKEIKTFILQHNIFSTEEKAKQDQQELTAANISSEIVKTGENYVVLLGIASNLTDAKTWQSQLDKSYAKEMVFASGEVNNVTEAEKAFIEGSTNLFQATLTLATEVQFSKNASETAVKQVEELNATLTEKMIASFPNEEVKNMANELFQASTLSATLTANSNANDIQAIQKHLLAYLAGYNSL